MIINVDLLVILVAATIPAVAFLLEQVSTAPGTWYDLPGTLDFTCQVLLTGHLSSVISGLVIFPAIYRHIDVEVLIILAFHRASHRYVSLMTAC